MSPRWVKLGVLFPIACHASEEMSSSWEVVSSSSASQAEMVAENLNQAVMNGIEYGLLFSTIFAVASMSLGVVANMINRSVGG